MDALFRAYLNGVFIEDEPIGLSDTELTITRDEDLKGVFFSFTSEITFWGDGYNILKAIRDTQAGCAQVPCNIEYKCSETGGYEVLYEGIIPLGSEDVEWDDYNCKVKTKIENADFSNLLQAYGDLPIKINTPRTINNTLGLTGITENATQLSGDFSGGALTPALPTYLFIDVLQQALSYLSDNSITLSPDPIYSTLFTPQILQFNFIDPLAFGDVIVLTFTNYYNQDYTVTVNAINASSGAIINDFLTRCAHIQDGSADERFNYLEKANDVDDVNELFVNYAPWSAWTISVNSGAKAVTLTETQQFQYGLKNLAITTSTLIAGQKAEAYVTLNDLLLHATQMHNMGFRLVKSGTGYVFNLLFLPSLLQNTSTGVQLKEIKDQKVKSSGQYNVNSLTTAPGEADAIFQPFAWNASNCYGDNLKTEGKKFSTQEFFSQINTNPMQDDALYFVFLEEGDYTRNAAFRTSHGFINPGPGVGLSGVVHYNMPYAMPFLIKRNEIYFANNDPYGDIPVSALDPSSTCSNCPTATITNENTLFIRSTTSFDYPLSYTQVRTLIDNSLQFINFTDGKTATKTGFIKEVTIPFKNFIASFELYTE